MFSNFPFGIFLISRIGGPRAPPGQYIAVVHGSGGIISEGEGSVSGLEFLLLLASSMPELTFPNHPLSPVNVLDV